MFSELEPDDVVRLEAQRALVREAARAIVADDGAGSSPLTVSTLQAVIDANIFAPHQTYELQCLGVAFGDALAADGRFSWVMVEDEYGRDPTLRWKNSSLNINALTMISKRVEVGDEVDLLALWKWAFEHGAKADQREGN